MAPTRKGQMTSNSNEVQQKRKGKARALGHSQEVSTTTPGVQKIKSLLRQTRRLLAKDSLTADVRVGTERRLKSLQADLEASENSRKERNIAVRYHKVKFFERQKVLRRIHQTQRKLSVNNITDDEKTYLQSTLQSHRVDLNYILYYPKMDKYVSLFPSLADDAPAPEGTSETDQKRESIRKSIRKMMKRGELSREPEGLHTQGPSRPKGVHPMDSGDGGDDRDSEGDGDVPVPPSEVGGSNVANRSRAIGTLVPGAAQSRVRKVRNIGATTALQADDFFEAN